MSPKIPVITAKELVRALKRAGFTKDHQRGSHLTLINSTTDKTVTITKSFLSFFSTYC
jgi:predicted RNA binding protein YcfA (HicA-like mRNA interferase family)